MGEMRERGIGGMVRLMGEEVYGAMEQEEREGQVSVVSGAV